MRAAGFTLNNLTMLGLSVSTGIVIDGGLRDLSELMVMKDLPMLYRGAHASAMGRVASASQAPVATSTSPLSDAPRSRCSARTMHQPYSEAMATA